MDGYRKLVVVGWFLIGCMGLARATYAAESGIALKAVKMSAMRVWEMVSIARSIALKDVATLNEVLFREMLVLYAHVYGLCTTYRLQERELQELTALLQGVLAVYAELCLLQTDEESRAIFPLMQELSLLWNAYLEQLPKIEDQS